MVYYANQALERGSTKVEVKAFWFRSLSRWYIIIKTKNSIFIFLLLFFTLWVDYFSETNQKGKNHDFSLPRLYYIYSSTKTTFLCPQLTLSFLLTTTNLIYKRNSNNEKTTGVTCTSSSVSCDTTSQLWIRAIGSKVCRNRESLIYSWVRTNFNGTCFCMLHCTSFFSRDTVFMKNAFSNFCK